MLIHSHFSGLEDQRDPGELRHGGSPAFRNHFRFRNQFSETSLVSKPVSKPRADKTVKTPSSNSSHTWNKLSPHEIFSTADFKFLSHLAYCRLLPSFCFLMALKRRASDGGQSATSPTFLPSITKLSHRPSRPLKCEKLSSSSERFSQCLRANVRVKG
jgi:hypothetical protein